MTAPLCLMVPPSAGALMAGVAQVAALAGLQVSLHLGTARARHALAAEPPPGLGCRRLLTVWLAFSPRMAAWLWLCGFRGIWAWQLAPALGLSARPDTALSADRFVLLVTLACTLSFVGRMLYLANRRLRALAAADASHWERILAVIVGESLQIGLPLAVVYSALPLLGLGFDWEARGRQGTGVALLGAIGYVLSRVVNLAAGKVHANRPTLDFSTSVRARTLYTQVSVLRRMALVVISFLTLASILLLFQPMRQLGASLLASAGVVGVIAGVASQRSLANLVAGFQIAVAQPILLEDVVVVEGEYGQIEEITLTYVVVRLWDLRRLVLPISYFLEKPFQNWTRTSAELIGTVFLYVDPLAPLDQLEAEFERVLTAEQTAGNWNGRAKKFVVFEAHERSLQLRLTMSADDPNRLWELRVAVRRAMADFLRREHPEALPRLRAEAAAPGPIARDGADRLAGG